MHEGHLGLAARAGLIGAGRSQTLHRCRQLRPRRVRGLRFDEAQSAAAGRHDEVHLESLLVAKEVQLAPPSCIEL
jgi:hypothetical protein